MKSNENIETLLVVMFPFVVDSADLNDWVSIIVKMLGGIWIAYQLIGKIRNDFNKKK